MTPAHEYYEPQSVWSPPTSESFSPAAPPPPFPSPHTSNSKYHDNEAAGPSDSYFVGRYCDEPSDTSSPGSLLRFPEPQIPHRDQKLSEINPVIPRSVAPSSSRDEDQAVSFATVSAWISSPSYLAVYTPLQNQVSPYLTVGPQSSEQPQRARNSASLPASFQLNTYPHDLLPRQPEALGFDSIAHHRNAHAEGLIATPPRPLPRDAQWALSSGRRPPISARHEDFGQDQNFVSSNSLTSQ